MTMNEHGKPNPIIDGLANVVGAIRADHDMHALAKAHDSLEPKAIEKLSVDEARRQPTIADAVKKLLADEGKSSDPAVLVPGVTRSSRSLSTATGPVNALVYTPDSSTTLPVILYFHGGGWVIADAEVYDGGARGLAKETGAIVVSVDYRQAPEHKFPAAWDDALAAYEWILQNAASLGGDPTRIALAGESAGGNLAATAVAPAATWPSPLLLRPERADFNPPCMCSPYIRLRRPEASTPSPTSKTRSPSRSTRR